MPRKTIHLGENMLFLMVMTEEKCHQTRTKIKMAIKTDSWDVSLFDLLGSHVSIAIPVCFI
jgi:hypothetical protein